MVKYKIKWSLYCTLHHGLINYKDTKIKCRIYWCLIEFIDWRHSHVGIFSTQLCELPFSLDHPPPPPAPQFIHSVWLGRDGGVLSCFEDHILQEFNTLFLTRFRTYKIVSPPQTKT